MAHQCTSCGHLFPDGSKEMLSGCPSCGGNKFQFKPGAVEDFDSESAGQSDIEQSDDTDQPPAQPRSSRSPSSPDQHSPSSTPTSSTSTSTPTESPSTSSSRPDASTTRTDSSTRNTSSTRTESSPNTSSRDESTESTGIDGHEWPETARRDPARDEEPQYRPWPSPDGTEEESDRSEPTFGRDAEVVSNERDDDGSEAPAQSTARSDLATSDEVSMAGGAERRSDREKHAPEADQPPQSTHPSQSNQSTQSGGQNRPPQPDSPPESTAPADSTDASVDELRRELNEQFESIRIVSPGHYELNLMELYDREEYIISLREDGRYVIEVPVSWSGD